MIANDHLIAQGMLLWQPI